MQARTVLGVREALGQGSRGFGAALEKRSSFMTWRIRTWSRVGPVTLFAGRLVASPAQAPGGSRPSPAPASGLSALF